MRRCQCFICPTGEADIKVDGATQHLQNSMRVVGPTLSELRDTPVAQDVDKLPLVSPPLLLSCVIQGLDGTRGQMLDCSDTSISNQKSTGWTGPQH